MSSWVIFLINTYILYSLHISKGKYFIRCRTNWIKEGELNNKYFLSLEKHVQRSNVITKIKDSATKTFVDNDREILNEIMKFYKNLYRDPDITDEKIDQYFQQIKLQKQLNKREADICGNPITTTELRTVVKSLKKNKFPGLDRLTSEFYQIFWTKLEPIYLNMSEESLLKGMLPVSAKRAIIFLICKKRIKPF